MIQPIVHDPLFLAQKSAPATPADAAAARDLLETLTAHADGCVGMAANMIGVAKRIIAVEAEDGYLVLFNPVILKKSGPYNTAVFRWRVCAPPSAGKASRCSTKLPTASRASAPLPAGRPRSSSTRSTTATAS